MSWVCHGCFERHKPIEGVWNLDFFDKFQSLEKELPDYDRKFDDLEKDYEVLINDKHISEKQHGDVNEDMEKLRSQWHSFNTDKDVKKNR